MLRSREARGRDHRDRRGPIGGASLDRDAVTRLPWPSSARALIKLSADIREATRAAVRHMIAFLGAEHGLSAVDAYMLCSVAGDLRMHEVVSASAVGGWCML